MKTYTAVCEREGKWWVVTVPELERGGVTQVRRIDQVEETVRDLVLLMTGEEPGEIVVDPRLEKELAAELAAAKTLRGKFEELRTRAAEAQLRIARNLWNAGFTHRDIGQLLGVSHQRAQQLVREAS